MPTSRMVIMGGDDLKTSWLEVVGLELFWAIEKIHLERPDVALEVYMVGKDVPGPGYDPKLVRIFVNNDPPNYTVAKTPVVG